MLMQQRKTRIIDGDILMAPCLISYRLVGCDLLTAARRIYLGVHCVPEAEVNYCRVSVCYLGLRS